MGSRDVVVLGASLADAQRYAAEHHLTGALLLAAGDIPTHGRAIDLHVTGAAGDAPGFARTHASLLSQASTVTAEGVLT